MQGYIRVRATRCELKCDTVDPRVITKKHATAQAGILTCLRNLNGCRSVASSNSVVVCRV
jgi:hypothetical protein